MCKRFAGKYVYNCVCYIYIYLRRLFCMCKELAQYVNIYSYDATTRGTRRRSLRCAASFHVAALSRSWRARRKIHAQRDPRGDGVCVCVTPWAKGSPPPPLSPVCILQPTLIRRGHPPPQWRMANEEATGGGCKRTCRTVVQAVTPLFLCLFPWWFMLLPLNPFPRRSRASSSHHCR